MKRVHLLAFLLLPFFFFAVAQAQSEGVIIPTDEFEEDLFGDTFDDEPLFVEDSDDEPLGLPDLGDAPLDEVEGDTPLMMEAGTDAPEFSSNLPSSATTSLSVVNISQNNADAMETGARPGDILRYEFIMDSQSEDVKDYIARINVSGIMPAVTFTDVGLGSLEGNVLTFPAYSQQAPCNQVYTFFVQVTEDCGDLENVTVSAEGESIRVNLNCGLSQTGPSNGLLLWGLALILAAIGMMWVSNRRTS